MRIHTVEINPGAAIPVRVDTKKPKARVGYVENDEGIVHEQYVTFYDSNRLSTEAVDGTLLELARGTVRDQTSYEIRQDVEADSLGEDDAVDEIGTDTESEENPDTDELFETDESNEETDDGE